MTLGATAVPATRNKAPPAQTCSNLFVAGEGKLLPRVLPLAAGQEEPGMGGEEEQELEEEEG